MKSNFHRKFNHDKVAEKYDKDVKNESNPVREGYENLISWVAENCRNSKNIVDLGSGTGNTIMNLLDNMESITCVDVSEKMIEIAREKLKNRENITFIKSDLLSFFDKEEKLKVDTIVSTYAVHHLTQKEKHLLFEKIYSILPLGGKIVFGDLMFKDKESEKEMKTKYPDLVEDFDDEFYWYLDEEAEKLESLGFSLSVCRFSDLSWGVCGVKK